MISRTGVFAVLLAALLCACAQRLAACEHIPTPGPESLDFEVTVRDTGQPVYDGMVLPKSTVLRWHLRATAYGSCQIMLPGGPNGSCVAGDVRQRRVAHISAGVTIDSLTRNGSFSAFHVYGRDANGRTAMYHVLDTHDLATTDGPRYEYLSNAGRYTFTVGNIISTTACEIEPDRVVRKFTVYTHDFGTDEDLGCERDGMVGNPCHTKTGNKYQREVDSGGDILPIVRHYNSLMTLDVGFGRGWLTTYHRRLEVHHAATGAIAHHRRESGYGEAFTYDGTSWAAESDSKSTLTQDATGYTVTYLTRSTDRYDLSGRLIESINEAGRSTTFLYDGEGRLVSVADAYGHRLLFTHDSNGRVDSIDHGGRTYAYAYDSTNGNLARVIHPDGTTRDYLYESASYPHHLTGIVDESGARWGAYAYDSAGRVTASQHPGGADDVSLVYTSAASTAVTDAFGVSRSFATSKIKGAYRVTAVGGTSCSWCKAAKVTTYDSNANVTSRTSFNGIKTCYANDPVRNLELIRLEGLTSGNCPSNLATYSPTGRQRKISTQWHGTLPVPTQINEPGRRTLYTYDASGNRLTRTEQDTATSASRTWTYTYDTDNRMLTADGPRTDVPDVTIYTYFSCATGAQCGQLQTVTNALGHVTTYDTYNAQGQPLTITDSNGVVTALAYDLRGRLTTYSVNGEQTAFEYWPGGLLRKTTVPDGSFLQYTYDNAHRLAQVTDSLGSRVTYTLDAMGNRTAEQIYDPYNTLTQSRSRVFDTANRLWKVLGAAGTANVTTTYGYDNSGNQVSAAAPLARNSSLVYDEFNRLTQVADPLSGLTRYAYNALDQLVSVTDPRNQITSYTLSALGDLTQESSPDTGVTINTFDAAGNVLTSTDARNKTATYSYDALNRITSLTYADQTIGYTYDAGTNQNGRLAQVTDASGSTSWTYDDRGRVLSRQQNMGITRAMAYAYDVYGRLQTLTLPSGHTVSYGYVNGRIAGLTLNGSTVILSDVLYQPFGHRRGWTWGNSTLDVREYDADGKVTLIDSAGLRTYGYDDASRITDITDSTNVALSQSYTYDVLDRLSSATRVGIAQTWAYDANGNRLAEGGDQSSTYVISSTSNRLNSVSGSLTRSYSYDSAGNVASDGPIAYTYNDAGRMASATNAGVTTVYTVNALGQRVKKATGGVARYYFYDDAGHLVGEYDASGALIQEIIWLEDTPVATLRPDGVGVSLFYIHSDHLNTPRRISRPSDQAIVWRWDADPFGTALADEDPDGDSVLFAFQLRFAGQYLDSETGLHYNYYRDGYDPATGRYIQSDPMSVRGHALLESILPALTKDYGGFLTGAALELNPYAYVVNNPIARIDPTGADEESGKGGGDGGEDSGGITCRLVGQIMMAYIGRPWLPEPFALLLCIYDCNTSCPGSSDNIIFRKQLSFNGPPWQCAPTVRRRFGE